MYLLPVIIVCDRGGPSGVFVEFMKNIEYNFEIMATKLNVLIKFWQWDTWPLLAYVSGAMICKLDIVVNIIVVGCCCCSLE